MDLADLTLRLITENSGLAPTAVMRAAFPKPPLDCRPASRIAELQTATEQVDAVMKAAAEMVAHIVGQSAGNGFSREMFIDQCAELAGEATYDMREELARLEQRAA